MTINVSIIEDNVKTRNALRDILDGTPGYRCASVHPSAEDALEKLPAAKPGVALLDLVLPRMGGVECLYRLREQLPTLQVLVFTQFDHNELVFDALKAGAA